MRIGEIVDIRDEGHDTVFTVEVTYGWWFWKRTETREVRGGDTVWYWHDTDKRCTSWMENWLSTNERMHKWSKEMDETNRRIREALEEKRQRD